MDTKQLRSFVAIVEAQTFTRAGRRLGLSQPAISQQLSALERQLGVPLLKRTPSGARPTAAGEVLLAYARRVLQQIDEAQRILSEFDEVGTGVLRVGAGPAASEHLLPVVMGAFRREFSTLAVRLATGSGAATLRRLQEGRIDVGLVGLPVPPELGRVVELGREELVAVAAAAHPWADRSRIALDDLAREPLLAFGRRGQCFRVVEQALLQAGLNARVTLDTNQMGAALGMARAGVGVVVVPRWAVARDVAAGTLTVATIGQEGLFRTRALVLSEELHRLRAVRAFIQLCTEMLPALLRGVRTQGTNASGNGIDTSPRLSVAKLGR